MLTWEIQNAFYNDNVKVICGCDEAGRGPLAGPVFAAAVILPKGHVIEGLYDSKKLSRKVREALFDSIRREAVAYAIAHAEVYEIEAINILNASMLAMRRAVEMLDIKPDLALIDGNIARDFPFPTQPIVKGDGKIPSIAAASILAKVARDRFCSEMDRFYPGYNFTKNKGYATKEHKEAILRLGPCPVHRRSFLKKTLGDNFEQRDFWQGW
ncbi:MAG: ribonuclease HII [Eubacteriales bacterium]|nr:ribonuclease HII [Eubacteriales bacterium]MDD4421414.1 ribonuclease HII [Eubacteriales bacterium]